MAAVGMGHSYPDTSWIGDIPAWATSQYGRAFFWECFLYLRKDFVDWHWAVIDIFTVFVAIMLLLTVDSTVLDSFVQLGHYALLNMEDKVVSVLIAAFDLE